MNKNIIFLTNDKINSIANKGIFTDLLRLFKSNGNNIYIVCANEKRNNGKTILDIDNDISILRVKTGNITQARKIERGFATLLIGYQFNRAIKKYFSSIHFDLVLYTTPPITLVKVIKILKKQSNPLTYLLLKDIFPQNAVDIGMLTEQGLVHKYFRRIEKEFYRISDYIGCMSPKNVSYLLEHNPQIPAEKVEVCPNSIEPIPRKNILRKIKKESFPLTFLYGGNLGKPQDIPFLISCLKDNMNKGDRKFIVCGTGTEAHLVRSFIETYRPQNITFIPGLPVDEYEKLVLECDVGMIFLDHRFTIPNFPSRILSYMEKSIPILACTDNNTDMGEIITQSGFGWWCESKDVQEFTALIDAICSLDSEALSVMGKNARTYLEKNYTVEHTYNTIMKHFT